MKKTCTIAARVGADVKAQVTELVVKHRYKSPSDFVSKAIEHYIQMLQQEA